MFFLALLDQINKDGEIVWTILQKLEMKDKKLLN